MSDHWQDNLRKRMDLHEEATPKGLWEDIEQHIDTYVPMHTVMPRRKIILWSISSVAVAAIAIFMIFKLPVNNQTTYAIAEDTMSESNEFAKSTIVQKQEEKNLFSEFKPPLTTKQQPNNESAQMPVVQNDKSQSNQNNGSTEPIKNESLKLEEEKLQPEDQILAISTNSKNPRQSRWQTNLSMLNVPSSSSETYTGFGTFAQQETVEDQYAFMSEYTRSETYTEIDHHLPIMVGLTFRYSINNRWGISSGLTYSLLTSKLRSESINYFYDDRQTLHYLGLPLSIDYKLWQSNNLTTYISAGGLVEKNIAGKLYSDYYIDNKLQSSTDEKITSKHLQWSINSAIGLEYRISDNIGIYAEPGVAYYFKNDSEIETIYKERPFIFNLRLGLRISFND